MVARARPNYKGKPPTANGLNQNKKTRLEVSAGSMSIDTASIHDRHAGDEIKQMRKCKTQKRKLLKKKPGCLAW